MTDYSDILHKTVEGYIAYIVETGDAVDLFVLVNPSGDLSYSYRVPLDTQSLARLAEESTKALRRRLGHPTQK